MQATRRYDLDWLRIAGVFLVVVFHTMMIFVLEPWAVVYIKDREYIHVFRPISNFIHIFHMPFMFVIAGMSVKFSLQRRTPKKFLQERVHKLLLPAVFGCTVLNPVMTYFYRISQGGEKNFMVHFIGFFTKNPGDLSGIEGGFTPAHFWFLIYLFLFSCIGLPLFLQGKKKLNLPLTNPYCLLLFSLPLAVVSMTNILDDKNPLPYFLDFVIGYYLISDEKYREAMKRDKLGYAILGLICGCIVTAVGEQIDQGIAGKFFVAMLTQMASLSIIFAFLGIGDTYWNKNSKLLQYLSAASFPIYIIHMLINTIIGFFVVRLSIPAPVKFLMILVLTIFCSLAVYECVRHRKKNIKDK